MANIVIKKLSSLDKPIVVDSLNGVTFTNESSAHQFEITCNQGGSKLKLTGSVSARFMRANNTTILLNGSVVDGKAVVTLHQDCYNVPGRFQLAIFNTADNKTMCVYAAVGTVQRTQTGDLIDSGDIVPSIDELLAQIKACETATAAANNAVASYNALKLLDIGSANTTVIANGTDYNTITAPGTYTVTSNGSAAGMVNCPTAMGHKLVVMQVTNVTPHLAQFVIDRNSSNNTVNIWRRVGIYSSGGYAWGQWTNDAERMLLLSDEVPDTVQTFDFGDDGSVSAIHHGSVRTDTYTYGDGTITEKRTLAAGPSLTMVTDLDTLETTVTYSNT